MFLETVTNSTSRFSDIGVQINRYALLSIIVLGNMGTCFNLLIYHRPIYNSSSCTVYLIASSFNTFILLNFALFTRLLEAGFGFNTTAESLAYCQVRSYIYYCTMTFSIFCTVLASVDRYLLTVNSDRLNHLQRKSSARIACVIVTIASLAAYTHIFFHFRIDRIQHKCCACLTNFYATFFALFFGILYCLVPMALMSIFGILTIRNIHRIRHVLPNNKCMIRRREYHLIRMTLCTVLLTLLLTLPFAMKHFYTAFSNSKMTGFSDRERFFMDILRLPLYINHSMAFYINIAVSKGFRLEFIKLVKRFYDVCFCKHHFLQSTTRL